MDPVRGLARDKVASPEDLGGATSNGMDLIHDLSKKLNRKPTVQEVEDEIFRLMPASQKIKTVSDLTVFAKELNQLYHGNDRSAETSSQNSFHTK